MNEYHDAKDPTTVPHAIRAYINLNR